MTMATTLAQFLAQQGIDYDILPHRYTDTSLNSAQTAGIPANQMVKSVVLEDQLGYLMAVVPATEHVKIRELNKLLHRNVGLATEAELRELFSDCQLGAIPPVGQAYGLTTVVDNSLDQCQDIYFEAGDHEELIHIKGDDFRQLMKDAPHAPICMH